ncbi:hypothetical protein MKY88_02495 [Lysinibacillus sp. FSL R7-0073]|uniref:hypothetical protein n=1 Tax=Lysinibacillus sp. FSL R7-0073 TaxID=2921669 RepID=UPI0030FA8182
MTLSELAHELNSLYPTRYSHFSSAQEPPFICYLDDGSNNFYADNKVFMEGALVNIELYTKTKDFTAEKKIKEMLNDNEIPYEQSPTVFIESEGVFQCIFSVTLI